MLYKTKQKNKKCDNYLFLFIFQGDFLNVPPIHALQPRAATTGKADLLLPLQPKLLTAMGATYDCQSPRLSFSIGNKERKHSIQINEDSPMDQIKITLSNDTPTINADNEIGNIWILV